MGRQRRALPHGDFHGAALLGRLRRGAGLRGRQPRVLPAEVLSPPGTGVSPWACARLGRLLWVLAGLPSECGSGSHVPFSRSHPTSAWTGPPPPTTLTPGPDSAATGPLDQPSSGVWGGTLASLLRRQEALVLTVITQGVQGAMYQGQMMPA